MIDMPRDLIECITLFFKNFSLAMLVLAAIFILFHKLFKRHIPESEIVYRWVSFFALGITGLYAFVFHAYFPELTAKSIGWATSPFQKEVAVANLAFGIIGILSFNATYGFRLATVTAAVIWLWGNAVNHIMQIILFQNYAPGNFGSWLIADILVPIILIVTIRRLRLNQPI